MELYAILVIRAGIIHYMAIVCVHTDSAAQIRGAVIVRKRGVAAIGLQGDATVFIVRTGIILKCIEGTGIAYVNAMTVISRAIIIDKRGALIISIHRDTNVVVRAGVILEYITVTIIRDIYAIQII